jgi:hypothetical protein
MQGSRSAGFWGLGRTIRSMWTWHIHGYKTTPVPWQKDDGEVLMLTCTMMRRGSPLERRKGISRTDDDENEEMDEEEPERFHATTAHLDEEGDWDWTLTEDPDLAGESLYYDHFAPEGIWLN